MSKRLAATGSSFRKVARLTASQLQSYQRRARRGLPIDRPLHLSAEHACALLDELAERRASDITDADKEKA